MGMIFFLSHQPGDLVRLPPIIGIDKLAHILVYGLLAASFLYGLQQSPLINNKELTCAVVVLFCLLYGIGDEYHQSFIPGRFVSIWDVAADGIGALIVVAFWYKYIRANGLDDST